MSTKIYTFDKKQKLADQISKLKHKKEFVKIYDIICEDNKNFTENQNGIFMFFHKLNNQTYHKIDQFLKNKKNNSPKQYKKEYVPYVSDEFPDQEKLNSKLKYSNKEKNLIKRQRYDESVNSENYSEGIIYQKFTLNDA